MVDYAISVKNVSKKFTLYHEKRDSIFESATSIFQKKRHSETLQALDNISFNVSVSDYYSTSDLFDQVNILLAYDDADDYYVPEFGINQIELDYSQGYYVFISGGNADSLIVVAEPADVYNSIQLMPYMMNNISYLPSNDRAAADVFSDLSILLVSNDCCSSIYVPGLNISVTFLIGRGGGVTCSTNITV